MVIDATMTSPSADQILASMEAHASKDMELLYPAIAQRDLKVSNVKRIVLSVILIRASMEAPVSKVLAQ